MKSERYIIPPPHFVVLPLSQGEKVDGIQMTEYRVQSTEYRVQMTDYRGQHQLVGTRHAVSANAKDDIVDVSDTACRVPTANTSPLSFPFSPPLPSILSHPHSVICYLYSVICYLYSVLYHLYSVICTLSSVIRTLPL